MALLIKNGGYAFLNKIGFNVFYVIMKGVPIITKKAKKKSQKYFWLLNTFISMAANTKLKKWLKKHGSKKVDVFFCKSLVFSVYLWQLKITTFANLMELVLLYTNLIWLLKRHIFIRCCSLERYMKNLHTGEDLKSKVCLMI